MLFALVVCVRLVTSTCFVSSGLYAELNQSETVSVSDRVQDCRTFCEKFSENGFADFANFSTWDFSQERDIPIYFGVEDTDRVIPIDLFVNREENVYFHLYIGGEQSEGNTVPVILKSVYATQIGYCRPKDDSSGWDTCTYAFPSVSIESGIDKVSVESESSQDNVHKLALRSLEVNVPEITFVPPGIGSIEISLVTAKITQALANAIASGSVRIKAWSYTLEDVTGTIEGQLLPHEDRTERCYSSGKLQSGRRYEFTEVTVSFSNTVDLDVVWEANQVRVKQTDQSTRETKELVLKLSAYNHRLNFNHDGRIRVSCTEDIPEPKMIWASLKGEIEISGSWPTVPDLLDIQNRRTYQVNSHYDGVPYTTHGRRPFMEVLGTEKSVTLNSPSLPFLFESGSKFILARNDITIQGLFPLKGTYQLEGDSVVRIGGVPYNEAGTMSVSGGNLEVIVEQCSTVIRNANLTCAEMDLRSVTESDDMPHGYKLGQGGKLSMRYGFHSLLNFETEWSKYESSQEEHKWTDFEGNNVPQDLWNDWKYILDFPRLSGARLLDAMKKDWTNNFVTLKDISYSGKPQLELWRMEVPIFPFYSNQSIPIVCVKQGDTLNMNDWTVNWNPSVFHMGSDFTKYIPQLAEYSLLDSFEKITQDGCECIAYKPSTPKSALNIVVYTSNQSIIEALSSGFSGLVSLVTPSNIGQEVTLINPSGKNVILICLDDVPSDKSIDLWGMRMDANIIVIGVPTRPVYDGRVFKALQDCINLPESDDFSAKVYEIIEPLVSNYNGLLPRVSLKIHKLDSVVMVAVNYVGSSIECELFIPALCHFGQIQETEIKATYVATDSLTYETLSSKSLNNLILVPLSKSPPDYLSLSLIEFRVGQWWLISSGVTNWAKTQKIVNVIDTSKVGQLYIVSHTDRLTLSIPAGTKVTSVKGVSVIMDLGVDNMYTSLPASPLLSNDDIHSSVNAVLDQMATFFGASKLASTKAGEKSATFTGDWNQVQDIQGSFAVDSGSQPIEVKDVPENVVKSLQVKSSQESSVKLPAGVTNLDIDVPIQVVSGSQSLSYTDGVRSVKFSNLTFNGGYAGSPLASSFSLTISGQKKRLDVANIKCLDYSDVTLSQLSLTDSLEMGIGSKFTASDASYGESLSVSIHYTIKSMFVAGERPQIDITQPKHFTLIYDNDESSFVMGPYVGESATVYTFTSADACQKASTTLKAENPNFQGSSSAVKAECKESDLVITLLSAPQPTPAPTLPPKPEDPSGPNVGAIVGGVIGALAVIAIAVVVVVLVLRHRKQQNSSSSFVNETAPTTAE